MHFSCSLRTTQKTEANDTSSRSHAICQVLVRQNGKLKGKLSLVDLAGSERGSDTKSHNSQRRTESADINTSLLSLKECMRALGEKSAHVPYRGSKLTLILKDCFSPDSKTTMITTVSPGASSTDHSLNTLRYADRIKEQRTTTTPATTAPNNKTNRMGGGGAKSPRPAPPPSKQRLQRISNANALAKERRPVPVAVDALSHSAGLVEALNSPTFLVEEDEDDDELLLTDSGGAISRQGQEMEDEDDDDEDYAPSDEELEEDHYYTPTASEEAAEEPVSGGQTTMKEDEEEMRRIVQALFELEEALLNQHMSNIQEHAEMLTEEGKLLQSIQPKVSSEEEVDDYAIQLAEYLDRKEILIYKLQGKLGEFKNQLAKEQQMAQRVHTLSQY
jgi:kinesin family protein 2/24